MGESESQWDSSLAEEYQKELNLQRTREQQEARENYQRLVNDYYNRYLDAYQHAMLYEMGTVSLAKQLQARITRSEDFDEEKLLVEENF